MTNKTLTVFGIGTYVLSVISSVEDLGGNYTAPVALIVASAIAMLIFTIMAAARLWKTQRVSAILFLASSVITLVYVSAPIKIINFLLFIWVVSLLWAMAKQENKGIDVLKNTYGLTPKESTTILEEKRKGNEKSLEKVLAASQERAKTKYKEATGVDTKDIVPEIGKEISWADVVNHAFRVLNFDRNNTTIDQNNQVKAKSSFQPYGYLLAESPILNNKVRIPIIHRDDFLLAASVFDDPNVTKLLTDYELLVTYSPKHLLKGGLSGSPHHVLHYVIAPAGTLDSYYSKNNDAHMANPEPQELFGSFVYEGEIKCKNIATPLQKTIVVIEDEDTLRKMFANTLRSRGYKVVDMPDVSNNKLENVLENEHVDAVISGIMQPYKDGLQVLKELKSDERYKNIPYVISSSLSDDNIVKQAMDSGTELYIVNAKETPESWGNKIDEFMKRYSQKKL